MPRRSRIALVSLAQTLATMVGATLLKCSQIVYVLIGSGAVTVAWLLFAWSCWGNECNWAKAKAETKAKVAAKRRADTTTTVKTTAV
ncbi:hypothetical protein AGMMS49992_22140 [Clostridia bacterium]|nr:hypothetical protein AGMMS49992_22140 [Clostridia bacterium]